MGLFVREDGHYQGWLAALLCCWIAMDDDESPIEKRTLSQQQQQQANIPQRTLCTDQQPASLRSLRLSPLAATHAYSRGINAAFNEHDRVRPISERPPSLKPLDLGETSLFDRFSLHSRRKSSTTLMSRISIGNPMDFRRLDYTEKQRKSLVPLQLEPVVLKRDSTPDLDPAFRPIPSSKPVDDLADSPRHAYRLPTPFERCQQLTSTSPSLTVTSQGLIMETTTPRDAMPVRPPLSTQSSSSSIRSLHRSGGDARTSSGSGSARNSFEKSRLKRKRSGLKGSGQSADMDVDREILELNTIIEERRAEATRPQSPAHQHVPAVAPRMPVRARSETLTDIGSAFSRPLIAVTTTLAVPDATSQQTDDPVSPVTPIKSRLSRPFSSMPDQIVEQPSQHHIRRPSSRVTGWLSNMFSTSSTPGAEDRGPEQFQMSVRHRTVSEISLCTTTSEKESHVLTSSSPVSKRSHSRSFTAESRIMTPISPPSTVDGMLEPEPKSRIEEPWPVFVDRHSQVGLAL